MCSTDEEAIAESFECPLPYSVCVYSLLGAVGKKPTEEGEGVASCVMDVEQISDSESGMSDFCVMDAGVQSARNAALHH